MKDSIEKELSQWKNQYDHTDIDPFEIDSAIEGGFYKAKRKHHRWKPAIMTTLTTAAILLFGFISLINFSPTFSEQVSKVPGLDKVVNLVHQDKGIQSAIENNYYEEIAISDRQGDFELTIDGVIRDQYGLVIFYTISSQEPKTGLWLDNISITNSLGEELPRKTISSSGPGGGEHEEYSSHLEIFTSQPITTNEFILNASLNNEDVNFSIEFEANNSPEPAKYDINKSVTLEQQVIHLNSVIINPTRTAVELQYDDNNDMSILSIVDLRIVNGNGETWSGIMNGTTRSGPDEDGKIIYYLQSNYFETPDSLYLEFTKAQALPKGQNYIELDLDKDEILFDPYHKFIDFTYDRDGYIKLTMKKNDEFHSHPFGTIYDEYGNEIGGGSGYSSTETRNEVELDVYGTNIDKTTGKIKLELHAYPNWIEEPIRIKIK